MPYKDKEKQKEAQRKHYLDNKKAYRKAHRKCLETLRLRVEEYKGKIGCLHCAEKRPQTLQFHHLNPDEKEDSIAKMVWRYRSWQDIVEESNKCIILCANCHLMLHYYLRYPEAN